VPIYDRLHAGLEIKTGTAYQAKHWSNNGIPITYWWQVQHYMAVTGLGMWVVFGLVGNRRYLRFVYRDDSAIAKLVEEERALWEKVASGDPLDAPMPIGVAADDDALRALGNPPDETEADLGDIEMDIDRYHSLGQEIKELERMRKEAKQRIEYAMGKSAFGTGGRYQVRRTQYGVTRIDTDRLKSERPEIASEYSKTESRERLTVKEVEDE
jgi:predicted phage-related endonuclease